MPYSLIPILLFIVSPLLFRGLKSAGVDLLATWASATRATLAVAFLLTASAHFTPIRHDLARMVPPSLPYPELLVLFTGLCEIAGAIGLLVPRLRKAAGLALCVFLVAVLPANLHAAANEISIGDIVHPSNWIRVPMQIALIAAVWWSSRRP